MYNEHKVIAMKLLIAEDEPDLAEALQSFFEKNQFTVDTVSNDADAYAYAQSGGYDALILDVMMPKLNGLAVVRPLRAQGFAGPIMLLTARGEKSFSRRTRRRKKQLGIYLCRARHKLCEAFFDSLTTAAQLRQWGFISRKASFHRKSQRLFKAVDPVGEVIIEEENHRADCPGQRVGIVDKPELMGNSHH